MPKLPRKKPTPAPASKKVEVKSEPPKVVSTAKSIAIEMVTGLSTLLADLTKRVISLERIAGIGKKDDKVPAPKAKTAAVSDPDEDEKDEDEAVAAATSDDEIEVPGFEMTEDGDCTIDEKYPATWNVTQKLAVAAAFNVDLSKHADEPRELDRQFFELLKKLGVNVVFPDDAKAGKDEPRAEAKTMADMPVKLKTDSDGLPKTSPVVGKHPGDDDTAEHVEPSDWKRSGKFIAMHKEAESFRSSLAAAGVWQCPGFNCHDCIENDKSLDQVVYCLQEWVPKSLKKKGATLDYKFPAGAEKYLNEADADDLPAKFREAEDE